MRKDDIYRCKMESIVVLRNIDIHLSRPSLFFVSICHISGRVASTQTAPGAIVHSIEGLSWSKSENNDR